MSHEMLINSTEALGNAHGYSAASNVGTVASLPAVMAAPV